MCDTVTIRPSAAAPAPAMTSRVVALARTENLSNLPKEEAACSRYREACVAG